MKITKKFLLDNGFKQIIVKESSDASDTKILKLFQKNGIALKFNGVCWDVHQMDFNIPAISGTISTQEDLLDGMSKTKLALDWKN